MQGSGCCRPCPHWIQILAPPQSSKARSILEGISGQTGHCSCHSHCHPDIWRKQTEVSYCYFREFIAAIFFHSHQLSTVRTLRLQHSPFNAVAALVNPCQWKRPTDAIFKNKGITNPLQHKLWDYSEAVCGEPHDNYKGTVVTYAFKLRCTVLSSHPEDTTYSDYSQWVYFTLRVRNPRCLWKLITQSKSHNKYSHSKNI